MIILRIYTSKPAPAPKIFAPKIQRRIFDDSCPLPKFLKKLAAKLILAGENNFYKPGTKNLITMLRDVSINCLVCYDLRFPVWSRQNETTYDVLIYVANWPERRSKAWKTLLVARAIENQCYVIGVNRIGKDGNGNYHSGDSMVVNAMGEVLYYKADEEDVFTFSINKKDIDDVRNKLPFLDDRDAFTLQ